MRFFTLVFDAFDWFAQEKQEVTCETTRNEFFMFFFPESFWDQDGNQMELETHNLEIGCSRAFSASILNFQGCRFLLGSHVADWSPLFKQIQPLVWRLFLYAWLIGWAVATIFSDYTLKLNRIYIACFLFWLPPPQWMYCGLPSIIPYHPSVCLHHFYHSYQMDKWWIFQGICMIYIYIYIYIYTCIWTYSYMED